MWPAVEYLRLNDRRGSAYCRNLGLRRASGDLVLFLDSDVAFLSDGTLATMTDVIRADPTYGQVGGEAIVGRHGTPTHLVGRNLVPATGASRWHFVSATTAQPGERFDCDYLPTSNCMMRREVALRLNGFDDAYLDVGEDKDFGYRMMTLGLRSCIARGTVVDHRFSSTGRGHGGLGKHYRTQIRFCMRHFGTAAAVSAACQLAWSGLQRGGRRAPSSGDPDLWHFEARYRAEVLGLSPSPHLGSRVVEAWHAGNALLAALLWNLVRRRGLHTEGSVYLNLREPAAAEHQ